jgi:hypothetical protein
MTITGNTAPFARTTIRYEALSGTSTEITNPWSIELPDLDLDSYSE